MLDSVVINDRVYLVGGAKTGLFLKSMYSAKLPLVPPTNLYFKDGNASAESELSTLGMADGSVTLGQLAPDALAKIGLDHNPATAEGNLLAVPRGTQPPPGYALYKRSDRNGSLVWEEKAPLSVGRSLDQIAYLQGKIYAVASGYGTVSNLFERYDVEKNQWESLPNLAEALHGVSVVALGEKFM